MRFFSALFVPLALLSTTVWSQAVVTLDTPSGVSSCQVTLLKWTGGEGPYNLSFFPAGAPTTLTGEQIVNVPGNTYSWLVKFAPGTNIGINIKDRSGAPGQTGSFSVAGSDTSCLSGSTTGIITASGSAPPSSSTGSNGPSSAPTSRSGGSSSSPTSSGAAAATSARTGAASTNIINLSALSMVGVAVIAVLV